MDEMSQYFVNAERDRPDFRLVITYLWCDMYNVDTDGNSHNPASRTWTELYVRNRQDDKEIVDVTPASTGPLVLCIESQKQYLAARTAYFLAEYMSAGIAESHRGEFLPSSSFLSAIGDDFDVADAMRRVESSPFSHSTLEDPYPNLREP